MRGARRDSGGSSIYQNALGAGFPKVQQKTCIRWLGFTTPLGLVSGQAKTEVGQMKKLLISMMLCGFVAGCGGSFGSLGGSSGSGSSAGSFGSGLFGKRNKAEQAATIVETDGRRLVPTITNARFERTKNGGIVRATALFPRQGYYDAVLYSPSNFAPDEKGVINLEFRAKEPQFNTLQSTKRSREITAGVHISFQKLAQARSIRVISRTNQVSLRR